MKNNRSSTTAQLATLARTAHFKERGSLRGPDHLAERFLDPVLRLLAKSNLMLDLARWFYGWRAPGLYSFVLARTLCFDDMFLRELRAGTKQIVLLGAGFDSRPYRFAAECHERGARVFELDAPATSMAKQARVKKVLGAMPPHVSYLPMDFNLTPLDTQLFDAGYEPSLRTLFLWEGVTFYLTAPAVDAVLQFVAKDSGPDSAIAFDYAHADVLEPASKLWGAARGQRFVSRQGEPFTFGIRPDETSGFLAERGLSCELDLAPVDIEHRYLMRSDGSSFGRVAGFCRLAIARARLRASATASLGDSAAQIVV